MDSKDFRYINALFDVLHDYTYSPIVICTQSLETEEYIQKKFNDLNVHFVSILEIVEVDKVDGVIALIDIEKVEENSTAQEWLSTLIDRCRENNVFDSGIYNSKININLFIISISRVFSGPIIIGQLAGTIRRSILE